MIAQLKVTTDVFRVWDHQRGGDLGRRGAAGQLAVEASEADVERYRKLRRLLNSSPSARADEVSALLLHADPQTGAESDMLAHLRRPDVRSALLR